MHFDVGDAWKWQDHKYCIVPTQDIKLSLQSFSCGWGNFVFSFVNCENVKNLHCRRHSFAHGLEESSVSCPQIFIIIIISYCIIIIILCTLSSRHHLSSFSYPYHLIHLTHTSYFSLFVILHFSLFIPPTRYTIHHRFMLTSYFNLNVCCRHSTIICCVL